MGSRESAASGRPGAVDSRLPTPDSPLPAFHPRLPVLADGNARLGENDAGVGKGSGVRCIAPFARCVASHSAKRDSTRPFDVVWLAAAAVARWFAYSFWMLPTWPRTLRHSTRWGAAAATACC